MITIHYLIKAAINDENYRCMNPACSLYEFLRSGEALPPLAVFKFCGECGKVMGIIISEEGENINRIWMEAIEKAGDKLVFPKEVVDYIKRMTLEIAIPDSPASRGGE